MQLIVDLRNLPFERRGVFNRADVSVTAARKVIHQPNHVELWIGEYKAGLRQRLFKLVLHVTNLFGAELVRVPNLLVADFSNAGPPQLVRARAVAEAEIERFDSKFLKARMGRRAADIVRRNEQL